MSSFPLLCLSLLFLAYGMKTQQESGTYSTLQGTVSGGEYRPLVYLAILSRNAAHLLPQYLGYIERLNYPKGRIMIGYDIFFDTFTLCANWF